MVASVELVLTREQKVFCTWDIRVYEHSRMVEWGAIETVDLQRRCGREIDKACKLVLDSIILYELSGRPILP